MTRNIFFHILEALFFICLWSCASVPKGDFGKNIPRVPDYSEEKNWAALPTVRDSADAVPVFSWQDVQSISPVDVFFIHPTTYTGQAGQNQWNADIDDKKLNLRTDKTTIRYQASIFNGAGRVYAPRYRQAHLDCFYTKRKKDAAEALDLAYQDVSAAFQYYLVHYNNGRPFIIASHSQGTYHAKRIIQDYVDGKPLQKQFVVAYLAGLTVNADCFGEINSCISPDETGCFCSWRTFRQGYSPPKWHFQDTNIVVTNPVTWSAEMPVSEKDKQLGGVLRDFSKVYPSLVCASVHEDMLWVNKPKFPGSALLTTKNYHIADYNFFYADIRQNAQDRVKAYFAK